MMEKELAGRGLKLGAPVYMRIFKEEMTLEVWIEREREFELFKTYPICTYGGKGLGPKLEEGDGIAPEGFYSVGKSSLNPKSRYHLAFNIGYPNAYDRAHSRTGNLIMVHGDRVSIGCFAMTDSGIDEIYALAQAALDKGQSSFAVHIFPFVMTGEKMARHKGSPWYRFWENLKEGYDLFAAGGSVPPEVRVSNGRYVFAVAEKKP